MKPTARLLSIASILLATTPLWSADTKFTQPASPRTTYNTSSPVAIIDGLSQEVQVNLSPFATK